MLLVAGDRNAPLGAGAGDAKVLQRAGNIRSPRGSNRNNLTLFRGIADVTAQEAEDLVLADLRLDRQFAALVKVDQSKLILGELEEVVLFGDGLGRLAVRANGAG